MGVNIRLPKEFRFSSIDRRRDSGTKYIQINERNVGAVPPLDAGWEV
jgi:hypothetical protein